MIEESKNLYIVPRLLQIGNFRDDLVVGLLVLLEDLRPHEVELRPKPFHVLLVKAVVGVDVGDDCLQ